MWFKIYSILAKRIYVFVILFLGALHLRYEIFMHISSILKTVW